MATQPIRHPHPLELQPELFSDLPSAVIRALEAVTLTNHYPAGAVLFSEGEPGRGIYLLQRGRVKLSVCASDGRTLILRIVEAGQALGAAASGTANTKQPPKHRNLATSASCGKATWCA